MRAAFLGLGAIGTPMAVHVAAAHQLAVWNRTGARAADFARRHGARHAATPREAAEGAEVVLTCLPTSREVEAVLEGPDGVLASLPRGAMVLDCTSGDPASSRRIAARLSERGIAFADAPVSGGTNGAAAGTLTVMVGGDAATFERARPVLAAFGARIEHLGPVGAGHAMKAVNNALLAAAIVAFGEGVTALVKAGLAPARAVEVLNASSGRSFVSEVLVPDRVLSGSWPRTFRLALLEKDTGIAADLARELGVPAPLLEATRARLAAVREALADPDADYLDPIRHAEREAGVEIRA